MQAIEKYRLHLDFFSKPLEKELQEAQCLLKRARLLQAECSLMKMLTAVMDEKKIRNGCRLVLKDVKDYDLQLPRYLLERAKKALTMDLSK